jgi:hypothetical protein
MEEYKTLYEWCMLNEIRPLDIKEKSLQDSFMLDEMTLTKFKKYLDNGKYKRNSTPRKPEEFLELRMYGLVPYNLSPIQQGIQFNHANDDYTLRFGDNTQYRTFLQEWKTNILLNGGTSNEGQLVKQGFKNEVYYGTMQGHLNDLVCNEVKVGRFYEPDLNSMLTAIVFLVDERVFDKKLYPDYVSPQLLDETPEAFVQWGEDNVKQYDNWLEKIGGPKNAFLRDFLKDKKLA